MDAMGLNRKRGDGTWRTWMQWRERMKHMKHMKRRKAAVGTWLVEGVLWIALSLLILLMACPSWAATVYIDPDCAHNGDGTAAACASSSGGVGAHNTLIGLSPVRGNTYQLEGSTIHYGGWTIDTAESGTETIRITSRGTGRAAITSRVRTATTGWSESGGVYSKNIGVSYIRVFWAALTGWGEEIPQDTSTPTSPADGKWGVNGTTIYYNPSESQAVPGTAGAVFEYSASSPANTSGQILVGLLITTGYVEIDNIQATRSAQEGIFASGSATMSGLVVRNCLTDYNGNITSPDPDQRIGNGIEFGSYSDGAIAEYNESSYNYDHGIALEAASGTNQPKNILARYNYLHHNGSCGGTIRGAAGSPSHGTFQFNRIEYNGQGHDGGYGGDWATNMESGIKLYYGEGSILQNTIRFNVGAGVYAYPNTVDGDGNGADLLVANNLMIGNGTGENNTFYSADNTRKYDVGGLEIHSEYTKLSGGGAAGTVQVYNNTVLDNFRFGFYANTTTTYGNWTFKNNIFRGSYYDFATGAINSAAVISITNNNYDATADGAPIRVNSVNYTSANLATWNALNGSAPHYVTVGTDNMDDPRLSDTSHLFKDSPVINGGVNVCTGEGAPYATCTGSGTGTWTDIKGSVVPHNGKISIGAYQFTSFDTEQGESAARKSWRRVFRKF